MSRIHEGHSELTQAEALAGLPELVDLSAETITENVIKINSRTEDARVRFVMARLVRFLHDFARDVRLSHREWLAGIHYLTRVGQRCTDVRQEFILLSDILGLSLVVDAIDNPKPADATDGTLLGPFHTHDAPEVGQGDAIMSDPHGEPLLVLGSVKDRRGKPVADVKVDIWETDSSGNYDVQHDDRAHPDGRCIIRTDADGNFWFRAIRPVEYPIPYDGPIGELLKMMRRHPFRPAHMHFMFEKPGWGHLTTALYLRDDPFIKSDAVFGVKNSLMVDLAKVDEATAKQYDVKTGSWLLRYDFVMITEQEQADLRVERSKEALSKLGHSNVTFVDGLPVMEVD